MSVRDFKKVYDSRLRKFNGFKSKNIVQKAYSRLLKGTEIRLKDIENGKEKKSTLEMLIDLPQVKFVKEEISSAIDNIFDTKDFSVKIIYGDYGQGKSQTSQILYEFLHNQSNVRQDIVHLENILTFRKFLSNISITILNHIQSISPNYYIKVEPFLDALRRSEKDDISLQELISQFIDLSKEISYRDHEIITIILDEFDKIIHDPLDAIQWVDFFHTLNDETDIPILLICFTPQKTADQFFTTYRQMERWQNFFSTTAIYLDGKYGTETYVALANILAINSVYNRTQYTEQELEFFFNAYLYNKDYLIRDSIRSVNLWGIGVTESILLLKKGNLAEKLMEFSEKDRSIQGQALEKKLKVLLANDELPFIEIIKDDTEDKEFYRLEYLKENLPYNDIFSDGHYDMTQKFTSSNTPFQKIAVEIKYTGEETHSPNQIKKIERLIVGFPTIFFSLGPDARHGEQIRLDLEEKKNSDIRNYPVLVINIPKEILAPILVLPEEQDPGFNLFKSVLISWSKSISRHRNLLIKYFNDLLTELTLRKINLKAQELVGISTKPKVVPVTSSGKEKPSIFLDRKDPTSIAVLISTIDSIKTFSKIETVTKKLQDILSKKLSQTDLTEFLSSLDDLLRKLQNFSLISIKERGKSTVISKTTKWEKKEAFQTLEIS